MLWWTLLFGLITSYIQYSHTIAENVFQESDSFKAPTLLLDNLQLTLSSKLLVDIFSPTAKTLKGYLGWLPKKSNMTYESCSGVESQPGTICLKYEKDMKLLVRQDISDHCEKENMPCHAATCHKIHWQNHVAGAMDCFMLGEDSWYGGGVTISQRWPLQTDSRPWYPAATGDPLHHSSGNVVENLWISSSGFSIYVHPKTPLFVSFNESGSDKICFTTSFKKHPYQNDILHKQELIYSICSSNSIKEASIFSLHKWIQKPNDVPDEILFQKPIWSTWARYKRHIDEKVVHDFATEILDYGFDSGLLEIDDKWENCYGEFIFDQNKFPDPTTIINKLKSMGFSTSLWVHPFCNKICDTYAYGQKMGYWVKNKEGGVLEVKWWNGMAAALDVTNEKAVDWYVSRLQKLQNNYGIDSFKFDAGEILWFESDFVFYDSKANLQPNIYSQLYAEIAAKFGNKIEVRTGYNTQHLPVLLRMIDKYSVWNYANGLQTLIPNALQLSVLGYNFLLPDMVGGNNYNSLEGSLPDRELYIRWLEANVFLPFIQLSIAPWDYDEEVVLIAKKMLALRERYVNYLMNVADRSLSGNPMIRPLWWIAPDDVDAQKIDSEFLLGEGILVAPILRKGARSRDIYLPEGRWVDVQKGKVHEGPEWLHDYSAPLDFLPFFTRNS